MVEGGDANSQTQITAESTFTDSGARFNSTGVPLYGEISTPSNVNKRPRPERATDSESEVIAAPRAGSSLRAQPEQYNTPLHGAQASTYQSLTPVARPGAAGNVKKEIYSTPLLETSTPVYESTTGISQPGRAQSRQYQADSHEPGGPTAYESLGAQSRHSVYELPIVSKGEDNNTSGKSTNPTSNSDIDRADGNQNLGDYQPILQAHAASPAYIYESPLAKSCLEEPPQSQNGAGNAGATSQYQSIGAQTERKLYDFPQTAVREARNDGSVDGGNYQPILKAYVGSLASEYETPTARSHHSG